MNNNTEPKETENKDTKKDEQPSGTLSMEEIEEITREIRF